MVSICIPTYNGAEYLSETILSVLKQSYQNLEIIISDDNSTDQTLEIAGKMTGGFPRVQISKNAIRQGLGGNWNRCLELASGEWIKYVFQDDLLSPDCIQKLYRLATQTRQMLAVCGREIIFQEPVNSTLKNDFLTYIAEHSIDNRFPQKTEIIDAKDFASHVEKYPVFNCIGEPTAVMFHRYAISQFGKFNIDLTQIIDWEYWMRIALHKGFCFTGEKLATFRVHGMSASVRSRMDALLVDLFNELIVYHELLYRPCYSAFRKRKIRNSSINNLLKLKIKSLCSTLEDLLKKNPDKSEWRYLLEKYRFTESRLSSLINRNSLQGMYPLPW